MSFAPGVNARWPHVVFALLMLPIGLFLAGGGLWLIVLGGSCYYVLAGVACLVAGCLVYRGERAGAWVYALMLAGTLIWSVAELGWTFWGIFPRIAGPVIVGLLLLFPSIWRAGRGGVNNAAPAETKPSASPGTQGVRLAVAAITLLLMVTVIVVRNGFAQQSGSSDGHKAIASLSGNRPAGLFAPAGAVAADPTPGPEDWTDWGRTSDGTRFAPFGQISPANVGTLKIAWTYRTGGGGPNEAVPLQVNDTLYLCTRDNVVVAVDAETGAGRWQYNPVLSSRAGGVGCRGVSFYRQPSAARDTPCAARIITSTRDARLVAVDARDGRPCQGFGDKGVVDLRKGMGEDRVGYQYNTSPALVVGDMLVVGAGVYDGQSVDEPSGVVRAYDAVTGAFRWAWDMGRPSVNTEPPPGSQYTRSTPNVWSVMSADPKLGLIYLPMGNATPDFFGGRRSREMEQFSSSIVALRVADGSVVWHFQTVHHDLWDYDAPAQPVLLDFPTAAGPVPAVILPTKRGEFFVFDRATGRPLIDVEERRVPQGGAKGDFTSATQPFAVGMPSVAGPVLREADMWGLTPIDQLMCRIGFKSARYEGTMTPPSEHMTIRYPGAIGGSNWGSVSIDRARGVMVAFSQRLANRDQLIPQDSPAARTIGATDAHGRTIISPAEASPQRGSPYAATNARFMSILGVPCQRPPYGMITAVDLKTRKVLWEKPIGTARRSGPLGIQSRLPLDMGVPGNGGVLVTRTGLTFYGGSLDGYIRAIDTTTGEELWRADLPVGSQATPMSYISPRSGRQFIAITAGGSFGTPERGDYVVAFALPR